MAKVKLSISGEKPTFITATPGKVATVRGVQSERIKKWLSDSTVKVVVGTSNALNPLWVVESAMVWARRHLYSISVTGKVVAGSDIDDT
jgi:hypothetical protein